MDHKHEYVTVFFNHFLPFLTLVFLPLYFKTIGLNGWQTGILFAIPPLVSFLVSFPIGMMNDKVVSRNLILLSMLILAVFYFGLTLTSNFVILIFLFILSGISNNLWELSLQSVIFKTIRKIGQGSVLGFFRFSSSVGISLGYILGGYLLGLFSFKLAFIVTSVLFFLFAFYSFLLPKTKTALTNIKDYAYDLKNKKVFWLALLFFIITFHWGPERTSMMLFLKEDVGLTLVQSGWFLGISIIALGLAAFFFGKHYDLSLRLKPMIVFGLLCSGIGNIGWYFTLNPVWVFILRVIHEAGDGAMAVFILLEITNLFEKKRVGGDSAFVTVVSVLGTVMGSVIAGGLGDLFGNAFPIMLSGIIMILGLSLIPKLDFSHH